MLVKELVEKILKDFESLPKPLSEPEKREITFTQIRFFLSSRQNDLFENERPLPIMDSTVEDYEKLLEFLEAYRESTEEATAESLQLFITRLQNRWERIKGECDDYTHAPDLLGNRAYLIFSRHLMDTLNHIHPYDLLFPVIHIDPAYGSHRSAQDLHVNEFKFK